MKKINLKSLRIFVIFILLFTFSILISEVYFTVTNSDTSPYIAPGQSQIGFENNEFSTIDFDFSGDGTWILTQDNANTGVYSIKSDSINHNQNCTLSLDLNIMESGYMSFYYFVDSEYSPSGDEFYDGLKFFINGNLVEQFQPNEHGSSNWNNYALLVSPGATNFSWSYVKDGADGTTASHIDRAWIDDMVFPLSEPLFYDYYQAPPSQNLSSGLFNAFVHESNLDYSKMKAKGGTFADFDLDGDQDLYFGYTSGHYFENQQSYFVEKTETNNINNSGSRGVIVGDLDNNGYPDILKWRYYFDNDYSHIALLNKGNHIFDRINYLDSNLLIDLHSQGLLDVDLDGDLDIVAIEKEGNEQFYCFSNQGFDENNELIFENIFTYSRDDESSTSRTLAIADFDNDGDQDVYVPRKYDKNWLFVNQTLTVNNGEIIYNDNPEQLFIESSMLLGIDDSNNNDDGSTGYGAAWADYDNDNDFDLYLTNWGKNRLYQNNNGSFINIAENLNLESDSLSNGAGWGDFNNDGYIDLWSNNFKREDDLFINPNGIDEVNWDNSLNPDFLSATQDVVPVDYNGDGWLDMFTPGLLMAHENGVEDMHGYKYTSLLYKNISSDSSNYNWLIINLEGSKNDISNNGWTTQSNHSAIGARVIVDMGEMQISREIIAGKGHGSMDPLQLHFGLADNSIINGITVRWPSKDDNTNTTKIEYFEGPINSNQSLRIVENIGFVGKKGDVNFDNGVNIIDIVDIVYVVLDNPSVSDEYLWAGDMDFNLGLNVIDITRLVNFIFLR